MGEIYVSTDIETDGPSPGHYSMLSFGSVAFTLDRKIHSSFERNLHLLPGAKQHPGTMAFWKTEPDAWDACRKDPVAPAEAMQAYVEWLRGLPGTPIFVAHPVCFDYLFISWYLHAFVGEDPFRGAADVITYAMALLGKPWRESTSRHMPRAWFDPTHPHTHRALDDALERAYLFCNMVEANKNQRRTR